MTELEKLKRRIRASINDRVLVRADRDVEGLYHIYYHAIPVSFDDTGSIIADLIDNYCFSVVANNLVRDALKSGKYFNHVISFREHTSKVQDLLSRHKERYPNFIGDEEDTVIPFKELDKLKVSDCLIKIRTYNFFDAYSTILSETRLYGENIKCSISNGMDYSKAVKWLEKYASLNKKYKYR